MKTLKHNISTAINLGSKLGLIAVLASCAPVRPTIPAGQLGMILDFTAFNRGQCDVFGRGIAVDRSTVLGGDYFKVTGDITGSAIRCTLPDGQVVQSVSHHQLFDVAQYNYAAMIVGRITGPGEVDVTGFNDGPQGKADLNGTFVFTTP